MQKNSTGYMYFFALLITLGCGVLLAFVSEATREARENNVKVEKMSNILSTVNYTFEKGTKNKTIIAAYNELIEEVIVDSKGAILEPEIKYNENNQPIDTFTAFNIDLKSEKKKEVAEQKLPVFIFTDPETKEKFYVVPMRGNGLWGAVWGYISLKSDFQTVAGVKFDHESETPGLGAEITKDWFQDQFKEGKKVFNEDEEVALTIIKGKSATHTEFTVDGISGATITGNGVNAMLKEDLTAYKAYFDKSKNS